MSKLRVLNLLDDFALGGVTKGLKVFDSPELREIAEFETRAIDPRAMIAPRLAADVIITHFPPNWRRIPWFHSLRLQNPRAALVHVEHSYSKEWADLYVPNLSRFRRMMQMALQPMDKIIVVSNASKRWMTEEAMVKTSKLEVIYPYSNMAGLAQISEPKRQPDEPLIIGAYGRFCDAKGFDRLIDAFKQTLPSDNLRLVIGGFGPDDAMLREAAADCDRISFVGKVTDVAGFLSQCHVVAVPSRYETYGQVANEARAAGRPILVSTAGGLPEQVGDGGIVVNCDGPDKLLAALRLLPVMPLDAMGRAGRVSTANDRATRVNQWRQLLLEVAPGSAIGQSSALNSVPALHQPSPTAAAQCPR